MRARTPPREAPWRSPTTCSPTASRRQPIASTASSRPSTPSRSATCSGSASAPAPVAWRSAPAAGRSPVGWPARSGPLVGWWRRISTRGGSATTAARSWRSISLDLVGDPIPDGPWDVIHERLVLQHVPERLDVLDRLVASLAPGGWILIEDFDTAEVRTIDREGPHHELVVSVARAFNGLLRSAAASPSSRRAAPATCGLGAWSTSGPAATSPSTAAAAASRTSPRPTPVRCVTGSSRVRPRAGGRRPLPRGGRGPRHRHRQQYRRRLGPPRG